MHPSGQIQSAAQTNVAPDSSHPNSAAHLDRLPIASFHRQIMWLLGILFFFELGDINTFSYAAPAIRIAWHLSISMIGVITSATFFGMFVGAMTGGWFSDRLGRKKALILSTVWYSGFSLLNAFAWNPTELFATRLLTGVGLSAMTVVGITYISEMFPARQRGAYEGWILVIGLAGIPVTAYVAVLHPDCELGLAAGYFYGDRSAWCFFFFRAARRISALSTRNTAEWRRRRLF